MREDELWTLPAAALAAGVKIFDERVTDSTIPDLLCEAIFFQIFEKLPPQLVRSWLDDLGRQGSNNRPSQT
jgi:hypothetical protein